MLRAERDLNPILNTFLYMYFLIYILSENLIKI
jgi:hypothetical protein